MNHPIFEEIKNILATRPNDYASSKDRSQLIDDRIGFDYTKTEARVAARKTAHQTWTHISVQGFQTPYSELKEMIHSLGIVDDPMKWCDLGAGYGRLAIALGCYRPQDIFLGFEVDPDRVEEGNRILTHLGLLNAKLSQADISSPDFHIPDADVYFIYDFGHQEAVDKILRDLKDRALKQKVAVIGRGRGVRNWISLHHPWLGQVIRPDHHLTWSYYQSQN
ncbi:MAG: hypothetical protein BroJett040_19090 [Oligoflexia bacterium]|nr:MAG: hypothetical protein BroJett040_19090 [Oligoflexia bacterium]